MFTDFRQILWLPTRNLCSSGLIHFTGWTFSGSGKFWFCPVIVNLQVTHSGGLYGVWLVVCMCVFLQLIGPFPPSTVYRSVPGHLHRWRCDVLVLRWGAGLLRRLLCASLVLKRDKCGCSLKAAPLSGCWRRPLIGKMQIFFDQEKD